jgi:hypothetical protein
MDERKNDFLIHYMNIITVFLIKGEKLSLASFKKKRFFIYKEEGLQPNQISVLSRNKGNNKSKII